MSEKTRRDKTLKLIEDSEDDEVIRVLTGYQPSVIQMLRREAICNITKPDRGDSSDSDLEVQGDLF